MTQTEKKTDWSLIGHSHQIADTGDFDGHYEITNGKISLLTKDDNDEALQTIVDALNNSDCKFYQDDWLEFENEMLKERNKELVSEIASLKQQIAREEVTDADIEAWVDKRFQNPLYSLDMRGSAKIAAKVIGELLVRTLGFNVLSI